VGEEPRTIEPQAQHSNHSLPRTSLLRHSPALVVLIVAIADIQRWADPDLWGHVAFGRAMLATHHLAFRDPYSYSAPGHLWLNHEWLSELLMAVIYNSGGVIGLKLFKFACTSAVVLLLALGLSETDSPLTIQVAILLAAAIALAPQMQFRPQLFTFAMFSALIAILARYTGHGRAPLRLAIPMLALWANLHGGFIVGLATLALFGSVMLIQDLLDGRGPQRGLTILAILAASTLATLATPYGFGTWQAIAHAMRNPRTREVVDDWQPLLTTLTAMRQRNRAGAIPMFVALAMFIALAGSVFFARSTDLPMVAIAAVMIVAALIAMRNLPLAVIATVIPLAHQFSLRPSGHRRKPRLLSRILVDVAATAVLIGTGLLSPKLRAGSHKPVGAIRFMREHRLSGNIMAKFDWGEYVIWYMAPASRIFIDGRYDTVYPPVVIDNYLAFHFGAPIAKGFLSQYPHDFVLIDNSDIAPLAQASAAPQWKCLYRDATCSLFVRANSSAARFPATNVSAHDTPASYFP
jgi:hypothetical protein